MSKINDDDDNDDDDDDDDDVISGLRNDAGVTSG